MLTSSGNSFDKNVKRFVITRGQSGFQKNFNIFLTSLVRFENDLVFTVFFPVSTDCRVMKKCKEAFFPSVSFESPL